MKKNIILPVVLTISLGIVGCASAQAVSEESHEDIVFDISWLEKQLQDEGVYASPNGYAGLAVSAESSSRLVLDGREQVYVYLFDDVELASSQAYKFSNKYPMSDVYLKRGLVVVRQQQSESGLSLTLKNILGASL